MSLADNDGKVDTVGLFLRAMVDREPGKRKVKASKAALIDLAQMDMGDSSDDSDFNVDEAKLNDDDDISINSDPDADDIETSSEEDDDDDEEEENNSDGEQLGSRKAGIDEANLTVMQLLERAQHKLQLEAHKGLSRPKILVCAVCLGDNSDDTNEIVTCDGWCHVSVHEGCYGVSDTVSVSSTVSSCSTEPWFCDACKAGVRNPPCELCPNLGYSIFKETEMGRWVHLVCALYVPGVAFSEVDKLSFPTLFEMAYSRWGSKICSLCDDHRYARTGVCIGCDAGMCRSYFHVTCAQREGLLSEVNHGEADQADPYYAHCRLHTDRELIRRRKRNWLSLQLHTKQADQIIVSVKEQTRLERKLGKYRDKYLQVKASRPTPWCPTQKMPRSISTCASAFRSLLHKTKLMGLSTETQEAEITAVGDIRKKWHIPPAFSVEFTSYYVDRRQRLIEMKQKLEALLNENTDLLQQELKLKERLDGIEKENKAATNNNAVLLSKCLELHNLLKGLAGRPLPLPPVVAAIHNPPIPAPAPLICQDKPGAAGGRETRRLMTKAAAKMMSDPLPSALGNQGHIDHDHYNVNNEQLHRSTNSSNSIGAAATSSPNKSRSGTVSNTASSHACNTSPAATVTKSKQGKDNKVQESHTCSVCRQSSDQNLQIQCDTCVLYYHLCCLDPPLTRMPKKTKQMGWQCSDCCKSSDSEKLTEVDTSAPRRLRRIIKEPAKFSPSVTAAEAKTLLERSPPGSTCSGDTSVSLSDSGSTAAAAGCSIPTAKHTPAAPGKRRRSSDAGKKLAALAHKRARTAAAVATFKTNPPSGTPIKDVVDHVVTTGSLPCRPRRGQAPSEPKVILEKSADSSVLHSETNAKTDGVDNNTRPVLGVKSSLSPEKHTENALVSKKDSKNSKGECGVKQSISPEAKQVKIPSTTENDVKSSTTLKNSKNSPICNTDAVKTCSPNKTVKVGGPRGRPRKILSPDLSTNKNSPNKSIAKTKKTEKPEAFKEYDKNTSNLYQVTITPTSAPELTSNRSSPTKITSINTTAPSAASPDLQSLVSTASASKTTTKSSSSLMGSTASVMSTNTSITATITSISAPLASSSSGIALTNTSSVPSVYSSSSTSTTSTGVTSATSLSTTTATSSTGCLTSLSVSSSSHSTNVTSTVSCSFTSSTFSAVSSSSSSMPCIAPPHVSAVAAMAHHPLDQSADSLPSVSSLHSPTSESLHSHEEDNNLAHSPRKEKRHRDGSKKKKKDKDKDRDKDKSGEKAEKKRKKHHHSYWDTQPHQSSEMLAPLRLKIKPLPPRPPEAAEAFLPSTQGSVSITRMCQPSAGAASSELPGSSANIMSNNSPQKLVAPPQHVPPMLSYPMEYTSMYRHQMRYSSDVTLSTTSLSSDPISHASSSSLGVQDATTQGLQSQSSFPAATSCPENAALVTITSVAGPTATTTSTNIIGGGESSGSSSSNEGGGVVAAAGSDSAAAVVPPPGYPPLPPGYTLTKPLLADDEALLTPAQTDKLVTAVTAVTTVAVSTAAGTGGTGPASRRTSSSGGANSAASAGRRKSEAAAAGAAGQQFSKCDVCSETGGVTNTVACDECHKAYHFNCLDPPLKKSPKRRGYSWFCEDCEPSK
uniref:Mucin-5AC-like n=1 Tax=Hirondellea gigas TaxID=1518452 RepID=A0A6A7G0N3_9CRUS